MSTGDPIRDRYPTAGEFREAIANFWGPQGWFRWRSDPEVVFAACPGCKSKALRRMSLSAAYPLWIREFTGGYCVQCTCGCSEGHIVRALRTAALALAMDGGRPPA